MYFYYHYYCVMRRGVREGMRSVGEWVSGEW